MNRRRAFAICTAVAVAGGFALGAGAALASVGFTSAVTASTAVSTGTLAPPSGVAAVATCKGKAGGGKGGGGGGSTGSYITVTWTASPSSFVSSYNVLRAVNGGAPAVVATNVSGTAWTDRSVAGTTTYAYTVQSVYQGWTTSSATPGTVTTAQGC